MPGGGIPGGIMPLPGGPMSGGRIPGGGPLMGIPGGGPGEQRDKLTCYKRGFGLGSWGREHR